MNKHQEDTVENARNTLAKVNRPKIKKLDFIKYERGVVVAVYCRCCGCDIKHMMEDEAKIKEERINGRTIVTKYLVLGTLPNYREVTVEFSDGSAHVMNMCADCAKHIDLYLLEHMYAVDTLMMNKECRALGIDDFPWKVWGSRKVTGWRKKLSQGFDEL